MLALYNTRHHIIVLYDTRVLNTLFPVCILYVIIYSGTFGTAKSGGRARLIAVFKFKFNRSQTMKHPLGSVLRTKGVVLFIYTALWTYAVQCRSKNVRMNISPSRMKPVVEL